MDRWIDGWMDGWIMHARNCNTYPAVAVLARQFVTLPVISVYRRRPTPDYTVLRID